MKSACDDLTSELAPFRAAELKSFRDEAIARGIDKAKVEAAKDAADLRRVVVVEKIGDRYGISRERVRQLEKRLQDKLRVFLKATLGDAMDLGG
mgnify:CR=1 FL=1